MLIEEQSRVVTQHWNKSENKNTVNCCELSLNLENDPHKSAYNASRKSDKGNPVGSPGCKPAECLGRKAKGLRRLLAKTAQVARVEYLLAQNWKEEMLSESVLCFLFALGSDKS